MDYKKENLHDLINETRKLIYESMENESKIIKKEIKKEIKNNGYNYSINNIIQSLDFLGKAQSCLREYEVGLKEKIRPKEKIGFKEYEIFDAK